MTPIARRLAALETKNPPPAEPIVIRYVIMDRDESGAWVECETLERTANGPYATPMPIFSSVGKS